MNRFRAVAVAVVVVGGIFSRAAAEDWKAARIWVTGGDEQVWVVAASESKGGALPVVQFWHAPVQEGKADVPRQRLSLPPVVGNPLAVAADTGGLHLLFSDLTTCDYFPKRAFSPGANWQAQCRIAPLAWCGDAKEPVLWALVETQALVPPEAGERDEDGPATSAPSAEIRERLAVLRLRDGIWDRRAGPAIGEGVHRFWMAGRGGDLNVFWEQAGEVRVATLEMDAWKTPDVVLKGGPIRYAWAGAGVDGAVFIACRPQSDGEGPVEIFQRGKDAWSMTGRLREGNEFLSLDPRAVALGVTGGQVAVARRTNQGQVELGWSDLEGARPVRFEALSLQREQPPAATEWQDAMILGLVLGMMTLVLWLRRNQVTAPIVLPEGLVPAAVWRRALGTILDFIPAMVAIMPWWLAVMPPSTDLGSISQQMEDPELLAKIAPIQYTTILAYGAWCFIWEALIGTSPGKFLFGCRVLSILGSRPTARQVFVRNLVRVIMVSMGAPGLIVTLMMIVMVTRNRQRVGDLLAGTIVVEPGVPQEGPGAGEAEERGEDDARE